VTEPKVVSSDHIFEGKILSLRVDTLREPDGRTYTRETITYGKAVVLVPVGPAGRLLMVRQYRHAARRWMLELPAGGVDDLDASPADAAVRELREETGYRGTVVEIGGFFLAPGYSDEYQHIFAATDLVEDPLEADEDEDLTLQRVGFDDALRLVAAGEICDAKSVAALLLYLRHIGRA
jgi:ADP-ribose pyrophosphatase